MAAPSASRLGWEGLLQECGLALIDAGAGGRGLSSAAVWDQARFQVV